MSIRTITTFAISAVLLTTTSAAWAAETLKIQVNGMVCAFCAQGIEKRLSALPQTESVYVNLGQKIVAVQAKPGQKFDNAKIKAEITDAGYDVVAMSTVAQSVAEIRASLKGQQ